AEAVAGYARGDDGQVVGVAHVVAVGAGGDLAVLVVLPDADQHVAAEDHDRGAGGQAVQPVGDVHAVGGAGDHQVGPQDEEDQPADGAEDREVEGGVAHEADGGAGGGAEG